jgi:hypothetical protein
MLVPVDGVEGVVLLLVYRLYVLLHLLLLFFLFLLFVGVDPSYKEPISIVLDVLHLGSWGLFVPVVLLKHLKVTDFHLEVLWGLVSVNCAHFSYKLYS